MVTIISLKGSHWVKLSTGILLVSILAISGCSVSKQESKVKSPEVIVVWSALDYSHDPLQAKDSEQFFLNSLENRTLFKLDSKSEIQNDLAKSFEVSKDGKKISITLEDNTFSDGSAITAADVKATLSRIMVAGENFSKLLETVKGSGEAKSGSDFFGITVPSKSKVVIELIEPDPFFVFRLAHPSTGILPSTSIGLKGEYTSNIHSGNYSTEVISNEPNATTVFNPRDPESPIINVVRKSAEDFKSLPKDSDVDIILGDTGKSTKFTQKSIPQLAVASWNIYVKDGDSPFSNVDFRKAVLMALDKNDSIETFANKAVAPESFTPKTFDSIKCEQTCKTDLKKAAKLVKEVYPEGSVPEITLHIENNKLQQELAKSALEQLNEIGVKANVVALDPSELSNEIARGNVQLFRFGWVSDVAVAGDPLVRSFKADSTENVSGIADAKLEKEISQYMKATTGKTKLKASQDMQHQIESLWLSRPIANFHKVFTISNKVQGYSFDFYGRADISQVTVEK